MIVIAKSMEKTANEYESDAPQWLPLNRLHPHPGNPRLTKRADVVDAIAAALTNEGGFDPAHALIVRLIEGDWQIISGHHRCDAAAIAGLVEVPCWVRDLDDTAAYMLLLTSNAQGELTALERGLHALRSGMDVKAYAASVGRARTTVESEVKAARVTESVTDVGHDLSRHFSQLVEIHAAPAWLWPALVAAMLEGEWPVTKTREQVGRFKDIAEPSPNFVSETALVSGTLPVRDVARIDQAYRRAVSDIITINKKLLEFDDPDIQPSIDESDIEELILERTVNINAGVGPYAKLAATPFESYAQAIAFFNTVVAEEREILDLLEAERLRTARASEEALAKSARLLDSVSLEEWKKLDAGTKVALLPPDPERVSEAKFNKQDSDGIEWAQWSWNPITGCLHDCPYCYARDLATIGKAVSAYPNGFAPTLRPRSLLAPRNMPQVPLDAAADTRFRNVFTGSMADIFGRWVPDEWIDAVLTEIRNAPQWNFLCLTKFPKRMAEFDIPENAWMGTTVDLQARVPAAEAAFAKIKSKVKWLSCEPMLEPLKFTHLDRFAWIVIGGASWSTQTPEWRPPYVWIRDLERQADEAGLPVYMKTNLFGRRGEKVYIGNARRLELPWQCPIVGDLHEAPKEFHYLGKEK